MKKLLHNFRIYIIRKITRNRNNFFLKKIRSLAILYIRASENIDYDLSANGEKVILQKLSSMHFEVLFDVGANVGEWSNMAAKLFPNSNIHSFEIAAPIFDLFSENITFPNIRPNLLGLADVEKDIYINYYPDSPFLTTAYEINYKEEPKKTIQGRATTGDLYCKSNNLEVIDFLKIDVEGGELNVLKGFESMLRNHKIKVIQFEYSYINIESKVLLKDFYDLLIPYGYVIGKLYPRYVEFFDYDYLKEDFIGPNFVAIHKDEAQIISKLKAKSDYQH